MNGSNRNALYVTLATTCIVGVFLAGLGLGSYFIRYGNLDSLEGTIPDETYLRVTGMFGTEKALLLAGLVIVLIGAIAFIVTMAKAKKPASY